MRADAFCFPELDGSSRKERTLSSFLLTKNSNYKINVYSKVLQFVRIYLFIVLFPRRSEDPLCLFYVSPSIDSIYRISLHSCLSCCRQYNFLFLFSIIFVRQRVYLARSRTADPSIEPGSESERGKRGTGHFSPAICA